MAFDRIETEPFNISFNNFNLNFFITLNILFFIIVGLIYVEYLRNKQLRLGKESGSAKWNTNLKEYNKTYSYPKGKPTSDMSPGNKNMILTNDVCLSMESKATMRNCNILVAGGSGSGKSRFLVKPNLLQANCSYVITDPKGELLKSTGHFLEQQGYEVKLFNLIDFEHSNRYNPFEYIRNDEGVVMMINTLIKNTNKKGSSGGDPFWEKSETALLQAICFYLYHECNPEDRNFSNVMKLLRLAEVKEDQEDYESTLDIMFKHLQEKNPEHIAVRQYAIFKMGAGKTLKSILISCAVRLTVFNLEPIEKMTRVDDINLKTIGDKKTALFVVIPDSDDTFNFLVAIMYAQLFETLYHHADNECAETGHKLKYHVRFMLDEFANIGEIPDFDKKLSTMRSREISCTIIIQNLAQLKTMYKDNWENLTGNCDTFLFLGGQEQTTLEYVSKKLGKETIKAKNSSKSYGKGGSSVSYNVTGRELMTPDEIGTMKNSNCILFIRGLNPFFSKKYDYPKHPNYKYTEDADKNLEYKYREIFNTSIDKKKEKSKEKKERTKRDMLKRRAIEREKDNNINPCAIRDKTSKGRRTMEIMDLDKAMGINSENDIKDFSEILVKPTITDGNFEFDESEFIEELEKIKTLEELDKANNKKDNENEKYIANQLNEEPIEENRVEIKFNKKDIQPDKEDIKDLKDLRTPSEILNIKFDEMEEKPANNSKENNEIILGNMENIILSEFNEDEEAVEEIANDENEVKINKDDLNIEPDEDLIILGNIDEIVPSEFDDEDDEEEIIEEVADDEIDEEDLKIEEDYF